jgi:hypothetical protein
MNIMQFKKYLVFSTIFLTLASCGGSGNSQPTDIEPTAAININITALKKYEGTWVGNQFCRFPDNSVGSQLGPKYRRKVIISPTDPNGKIKLDLIEEFFDNQVDCSNLNAIPIATIKESLLSSGEFIRVEKLLFNASVPLDYDVVRITQPQSPVIATGTKVTQKTISGSLMWQVDFSDGSSTMRSTTTEASQVDAGFLLRDGLIIYDEIIPFTKL